MRSQLAKYLTVLAGLIAFLYPALAEAQHYYVPRQPVYQQAPPQYYVAVQGADANRQAYGVTYYTVAYDRSGRAWYVPVQQTVASPPYRHHHVHEHPLAPGFRDARNAVADVADVVLTLHPGAWLAEGVGLIDRDRIVDRIRGHRHHHGY